MATAFGSFIDVESSPSSSVAYAVPAAPHKAFPKDYHSIPLPRSPDDLDLENIQFPRLRAGPAKALGFLAHE